MWNSLIKYETMDNIQSSYTHNSSTNKQKKTKKKQYELTTYMRPSYQHG